MSVINVYKKEYNEHGIAVLRTTCPACKREYTITPYPKDLLLYNRCTAPDCVSYDPARDIEHLFV